MKNKKIIIRLISAIALILISVTSYKIFEDSNEKSNDPSKLIFLNFKILKI